MILHKEQFPRDIGGGLEKDLTFEEPIPGTDEIWSVALAKKRRLTKSESESFRLKLEELTGLKWKHDQVSRFVFHYEGKSERKAEMAKVKKIKVETKITRVTKKKGCFGLGVGDIDLSEDQRNRLDEWIDDSEVVYLTIEPKQEKLPGM